MKASKLLFGAAGLSIAAAGLFMGAGTASAVCDPDTLFCGGGISTAVLKLDGVVLSKSPDLADIHITKVIDKMSP